MVPIVVVLALGIAGCGEATKEASPVLTFGGNTDAGMADISRGGPDDAVAGGDITADSATEQDIFGAPDVVDDGGQDSDAAPQPADTAETGDATVGDGGCQKTSPATEACDGLDNDCDGQTDEDGCSDGNACTSDDKCVDGACKPGLPVACDDANPCTNDTCDAGSPQIPGKGCLHADNIDACDDGDVCTTTDVCAAGTCSGVKIDCSDGNQCTVDVCDSKGANGAKGGCTNTAASGACDDGNACTKDDACAAGKCVGSAAACSCTKDADCAKLEDGNACNGTLTCVTTGAGSTCALDPATVVKCVTKEPCYESKCQPDSGVCAKSAVADGLGCDDGDPCSIGDHCDAGKCTPKAKQTCDDNNACTTDSCDVTTGACAHNKVSDTCDDGNPCTVGESCITGKCEGGKPNTCDDDNPCTDDSCAPTAKPACQHSAVDGACDDNDPCTTGEKCATGSCAPTGKLTCNDANPCTKDSCDSQAPDAKNACKHLALSGACTDGSKCTASGACVEGQCKLVPIKCDDGNLCTKDSCNGATAGTGCVYQPISGATCDDGKKCTVQDQCKNGACIGAANPCSDGNDCTFDSCTESTGCGHAPSADGAACGATGACGKAGACKSGVCNGASANKCDDGNPCTNDICNDGGGCSHAHNIASCDDGDKCTSPDVCSGGLCKSGVKTNCDDGVVCTVDSCDKTKGCVTAPKADTYMPPCDGAVEGNSCYKAFAQWKNWPDAQKICKAWGGHLATISSELENTTVRLLSIACTGQETGFAWIGLNDFATEGKFLWADNTPLKYTKWRDNEPNNLGGNEDAVAIYRNDGTWLDYAHFAATQCWVCERPLPALCDDPSKCVKKGRCDKAGACKSETPGCDDGNACTLDTCDGKGGCTYGKAKDGTNCAGTGVCSNGLCLAGVSSHPASSCAALHASNPTLKSGVYMLDPDGAGVGPKFKAYCDMTSDGGGWTLVMKIDGNASTFAYDSGHWKSTVGHNWQQTDFDNKEAKLLSYATVGFSEVRVGMQTNGITKWLKFPYKASSLYSVIADGKHRPTKLGPAKWRGLISSSSMQNHCNREGFNAAAFSGQARVRIGLIANNENNCFSPDSRIGLGGRGLSCKTDNNNTCGNAAHASCQADNGTRNIKSFGYVLVR